MSKKKIMSRILAAFVTAAVVAGTAACAVPGQTSGAGTTFDETVNAEDNGEPEQSNGESAEPVQNTSDTDEDSSTADTDSVGEAAGEEPADSAENSDGDAAGAQDPSTEPASSEQSGTEESLKEEQQVVETAEIDPVLMEEAPEETAHTIQEIVELHALETEESIYDRVEIPAPAEEVKEIDPAILNDYTIGNEGAGIAPTFINDEIMKIAILGDSQFGNFKDYDGMAYLLSQYCKADVYNFAIGGTAAAVQQGEPLPDGLVTSNVTGIGMAEAMIGKIPLDFLKMYPYVYNLFDICDFDDIDVFIVEFGVNDYLSRIPISIDNPYDFDYYSYRQAMGLIVSRLHERFPDAMIFACSPGYAQFFSNNAYLGDGNTLSNGYGKLVDYVNSCNNVIERKFDYDHVRLMNPYYMMEINGVNARDYLLDGIHLNREGREKYAQLLARLIIRSFGYSIGEGVNPLDVDWLSTKTE